MNPAALAARQKNERRILEYVVANGETSRVTLANALGVSTATVTNIVTDLIDRNLLYESRKDRSTAGRKTTLLKFNGDLLYILALEFRVDNIMKLSVCNLTGDLLTSETTCCETTVTETCTHSQVLKNILGVITRFLQAQPEHIRSNVKLIGLCLHGMVNAAQTFDAASLNWKNFNLSKPLQAALGMPVYAEGITRIMANYEMRFIDPAEKNVIFLNLDNGIGMVHFFNKKMITGRTGIAGEVGHISLDIHGPRCYCGNRGCFEYYCSMFFVLKRAQQLLTEENKLDPFYDMVVNQKLPLTPELLFQAQEQGSLIIHDLLCSVSEYLGAGIANLYNIYDPDRIIVTADPPLSNNFLLENAKIEARSRIVNQFSREINISAAHLSGRTLHRGICDFVLWNYLDSQR